MKFTKRTLSAILALAVVFSTLVFISVGASVDFPVHNTYVTLSGGKTQNCKQSEPLYEASGKIGYANSQEFSVDAWFKSDASRLSELVQESEAMGECVCIDLYAEFTSALNNETIGASINFGAGDVLPKAKYTNVANPTSDHAVDFVNHEIVTLKLWIDDIVQVGSVDELNQVMITVYPALKDKVTGTFFYSAPYIESKDGENLSTVNITSVKTTTAPPTNPYDGSITCYDSGVTFAGSHQLIKAQYGTVNEAFAHYGDAKGFEKKYLHIDGSGQQIQYMNGVMNGLEQLRARAAAGEKSVCIDIYSNKFANGSVKDGKCQFYMDFGDNELLIGNPNNDSDRIVLNSGIKQTIVFSPDYIPKNATKMNLTFQNYSYGDYRNITDAKFIVTAPYVEGDAPLQAFKPSTTVRPTKPPKETWDGKTIVTYNNGVSYQKESANSDKAKYSWAHLTNGSVKVGTSFIKDRKGEETSYVDIEEPSEVASSSEIASSVESSLVAQEESVQPSSSVPNTSSVKGKYVNNYLQIYSQPRTQIQIGSLAINGFGALIKKARETGERMFVDLYAANTNLSGYFILEFSGYATGEIACQVDNNKKQTLELDVDMLPDNPTTMSVKIQNYSFGNQTIGGNFIMSVPYLESDIKRSSQDWEATTKATEATESQSTTPAPTVEYEEGDLPIKVPDSPVTYTGGWGNPTNYTVVNDKKISILSAPNGYSSQLQIFNNASGLSGLLVEAASKGKNVCVDLYGNFLSKSGTAKVRLNVGNGIWYGADTRTDSPDTSDMNGDKMMTISPNTVTTIKINPRAMFDYLRANSTPAKKDDTVKEFETLTSTGDITPTTFTQNDIEPKSAKLHQIDDVSKNDYIEYTIPSMKASTYNVKLNTRDLASSGEYAVYINGTLIDTIDFYSQSKTYNTRDLGEVTIAKDGDVKVKLVSKGNYAGTALMLDSIKFTDLFEEQTTAAPQNTNEELAKKCTSVAVNIWGSGSWNADWSTKGRFYMTVPYIEGAVMGDAVQGVTTTTTAPPPSTVKPEKFNSINDVDLSYVDCRFSAADDWEGTGERAFENRTFKCSGTGKQIHAKLDLNGGSITKQFNNTDDNVWDYVQYAKNAGARLAMDVYAKFTVSNGSDPHCHMVTAWAATGNYNYVNEAENVATKTGNSEAYLFNKDDFDIEETAETTKAPEYSGAVGKTFDKYSLKVDDVVTYTISGVAATRYAIKMNSLFTANGGKFKVYVNDKEFDKISTVSSIPSYKGGSTLVSDYNLAETGDVTIKFVCAEAGDLYIDSLSINEKSITWPTGEKDFEIASGTKYTYYIDPNDIPLGSNSFTVRFNTYDQDKYGDRNFNSDTLIYLTAPYLVDVKTPDKTTVTTTKTTEKTKPTTTLPTYAYPSNNGGGKTRFTVGDVYCGPTDTVKVPINISNNAGLYNAKFSIKFNQNDLYYVGCTNGEVFDNISINEEDIRDGILHITVNQSSEDALKNGAVAYLEFDTKNENGVYPISFAGSGYIPSNFFNFNSENVPCSFRTGYVIVDTTGSLTRPVDFDAIIKYPTTSDGSTRFKIESVETVKSSDVKDKEFNLNISISGNEGIAKAKFTIEYDVDKLQFVGSSAAKSAPPVFNLVDYNFDPIEYDPGILTYEIQPKAGRTVSDSYNNGNFVTMKFKLLTDEAGKYDVSFGGESYNANDFKDCLKNNVSCSFESGGIVIKEDTNSSNTTKPNSNEPVTGKLNPAKVTVVVSGKKAVTVKWSAVKNATKYQVYRSVGASKRFVMIGSNVINNSFKDTKVVGGNTYKYKVVALNSSSESTSNVVSITTMNYNKKPVIKSLKPSKKKIKVQIKKKEAGVVGFQVKVSTNKKFKKKLTKTALTKKLTKTFKKLKSGKKYFVKVRAYNVVNGKKVYGKWSKVKAKIVK